MLPLNIVNEKIYLVLWMWYIILTILSSLAVLYRITCVLFPELRTWMLWKSQHNWAVIAKICQNRPVDKNNLPFIYFINSTFY